VSMNEIDAVQRTHLWFETGDGMFFGLGRVQLLERIETCGSLNKAAAAMGMSYRAAWGRLKKTEAVLGEALVEKTGPKQGFRLTPLGRELVDKFHAWHARVEEFALAQAKETFPWSVRPFEETRPVNEDKTLEKDR